MLRKLIQVGGRALLVTLPVGWIKLYNLRKGDEVDVHQENGNLVIYPTKSNKVQSVSFDVSMLKESVGRFLTAIYRKGYDEVEIKFSSKSQLDQLVDFVQTTTIGYEIVGQKKHSITIKSVATTSKDESKSMLRRLFTSVIVSMDDVIDAMSSKNEQKFIDVIEHDKTINKYADFCRRVSTIDPTLSRNLAPTYYVIADKLEKIGDKIKAIAIEGSNCDSSSECIQIFSEVAEFARHLELCMFRFDQRAIDQTESKHSELMAKMKTLSSKGTSGKSNLQFTLSQVQLIQQDLFDMIGPIITYHM